MATATKNYKPMTDSECDAFRALQRLESEARRIEAERLEGEKQVRLDRISGESVTAAIVGLSQYDRDRLTKGAKTRMKAAGYTSVRDDRDKLTSVQRDIMRELLAVEMTVGDIEED